MKKQLIAGNMKCNLREATVKSLSAGVASWRQTNSRQCEVVLCSPNPYLHLVSGVGVAVGAQNVHSESEDGAYTGEVNAEMLADSRCRFVIVGHSERRQLFGETDEDVNRKAQAVLAAGMRPIVCVGELLEDREADETASVIKKQLHGSLHGISSSNMTKVEIAYEPIWAIGTGKVATPEQAEEVHALIRAELESAHNRDLANSIRILYGGSVKANNAKGLLAQENINGALVGGACLKSADFCGILEHAT